MINSMATFLRKFSVDDIHSSKLRVVLRSLAVGLGILHVYAAIQSQSMNADGIAYLDIADAYFRADWAYAVNAVWSPLYSWILGFVSFIFKPSMAWEFPIIHIANYLIFLAALISFEFMWENVRSSHMERGDLSIPEPFWWGLGYLLFIWTTLSLIEIWAVTPDMLMATFVLLAAGIIAKIRSGDDRLRLFLSLGLVLGLGYLSKAFMFSIAIIFLLLAWLVQQWTWASVKRTLPAIAVFLLMSLPYIALISGAKGKFTIGEAGTVTYVRHVLGIPYPHWQGDPAQGIMPAHPSRIIHQSPTVYEFGEPIGGTYPIAFDPSYWYEGIDAPFTLSDFTNPLLASVMRYLELFFQKQGTLVACVLIMYLMRQRSRRTLPDILRQWALVIPAIVAFGLYALILVEDRYIGVFVVLFWADILANVRLPASPVGNHWGKLLSGVAATGLLASIILFNLDGFMLLSSSVNSSFAEPSVPAARPLAVAEALADLGIQPGDQVGVIGYAYDSFWARLAKVRITAEMLDRDAEELWRGDNVLQQSVLESFADAGVKAVVAEYVPPYADVSDWHRVGNSNYYIYRFGQ